MIHALKPYPVYKDSGVPWLGEVPEKWNVLPALAVYKPRQVKNTGMLEKTVLSLSYGRIIVKPSEKLHGLVPESFETYQIVDAGNIVVRTTDLQNDQTSLRVGHCNDRGIITSAYMCLETKDQVSNEFGYQFLNAYDLLKIIYGFGSGLRQNLDFVDIKRMPVLVPPKDEQSAIVRFLDHADRRIRRYIRAKQKLIKLLEEQKQAIIHRAVTRGLDPNVRLKPSGVEWLGDVPEHWEVRKLGQITVSFRTGPFGSILHQTDYVEGGTPVINPTHMAGGRIIEDTHCGVPPTVRDVLINYRLELHDLIFARRGQLGRCALVREREVGWLCGTGSIRVRVSYTGIEPEYLIQLLQVRWVGEYLSLFSVGATMDSLNTGILKRVPLLLPPVKEQRAILAGIAEERRFIDSAVADTHREIALIREYRTRLIADVVTGKLDVREAAAKLPDETDEPESFDEADAPLEDDNNAEDADLDVATDEAEA
ncbi:MAG: restriction endonuclease subunit S [Nitrospiraceae bacterium]